AAADRGRHRADAAVLDGHALRLQGPVPFRRGAARPAAASPATAPSALHRLQQRGQRALGGAHRLAHAVVLLRAARRPAAPTSALSRDRARGRALRHGDPRARAAGVGHAGGPRRGRSRRGAARDRAGVHGYQRKMAVLRSDATGGSVPNSFDRSLLRLRRFHEYLDDGWALIGTPDEVRDGLQRYLDASGLQRVMLLMALPGLATALALRSMRLFADEVAPAMTPVAHGA